MSTKHAPDPSTTMLETVAEPHSRAMALQEWLDGHPELWCVGHGVQTEIFEQYTGHIRLAGGHRPNVHVVARSVPGATD